MFGFSLSSFSRRLRALEFPRGLLGMRVVTKPNDLPRISLSRLSDAQQQLKGWLGDTSPTSELGATRDIRLIDSISRSLCEIADTSEFVRSVLNDSEWIDQATRAVLPIQTFMNDVNTDSKLYERLVRGVGALARYEVGSGSTEASTSSEYSIVAKSMIDAMESEGVGLPEGKKAELKRLLAEDMELSFRITRPHVAVDNTLYASSAQGVEKSRTESLADTAGSLPRDQSSGPSSMDENLRRLVEIRNQAARVRGYRDFASYARRESVLSIVRPKDDEGTIKNQGGFSSVTRSEARSRDPALGFLTHLWKAIEPAVVSEIDLLRKESGIGRNFSSHNELMRALSWSNYKNNQSGVSVSLKDAVTAFVATAKGLLDFEVRLDLDHDVWSDDVFVLRVDGHGKLLGHIYVDAIYREGKPTASAQFTVNSGTRNGRPAVTVITLPNMRTRQGSGLEDQGSTLEDLLNSTMLSEHGFVTFFHELGHAVHCVGSQTELQHFSGSRGCIDYVEFPSHLFELLASDWLRSMKNANSIGGSSYAGGYVGVGGSAPSLVGSSHHKFPALELAQQVAMSLEDHCFYSPEKLTPASAVDSTHAELVTLVSPGMVGNDHVVHYGSLYYAYPLSRTLASMIHSRGGFSSYIDQIFKRSLLSAAGASSRGVTHSPVATPVSSSHGFLNMISTGSVHQTLHSIYSIVPGLNSLLNHQSGDLRVDQAIDFEPIRCEVTRP